MARCGDGLAAGADLAAAARAAARQALAALDGRSPELAFVFASGSEPTELATALEVAADTVGAATTVGCSAHGVIGAARGVESGAGVSVWAAALPGARLRAFHLEVLRTEEALAVVGMPRQEPADRVGVLLADPWSFPSEGFVTRSNEALPGLPLVGGLATGPDGAGSTRLLVDGKVVDRGAVGVVVGGASGVRTLVSQGCRPVGPLMTVTAADGNVLLGLAGVPALRKVRDVVSDLPARDQALASRGLQLGLSMDEYADRPGQGDFLVRGVLGSDHDREGLVVADVLEVGSTVQLHVRDADAAAADLAGSLHRFRHGGGLGVVDGALLVSCTGRGSALFRDADHDVRSVRSVLATGGVAGFFAAGEIGPVGGRNHVHGFSASMLVVGSAEEGPAA